MTGSQHLVHGLHAVQAALNRPELTIRGVWVEQGRRDRRMAAVLAACAERGLTVQRVDRRELDRLSGGAAHQGVVIDCPPMPAGDEVGLERLLDGLHGDPFLLVLDQVQDPHNLGACLRTADAAGVQAVITTRDRAAGLTPVVHKVASGATRSVPFIQVTNLARTLDRLRQRGIWLVGAAGDAPTLVHALDLKGPLAVVMGAEGGGLRRLTRERCDHLAKIPMVGTVESLNVSVATGVMLFEALRQRLV
ncbi:23S rRNA (guanosine(2251)-2'-O)-methyltransferase RlmB [Methylonatrum kenyense]|uniref:23S rRNA (guanosine(2251)-2'-O)-methyltransferase RlmB n=1 Tax=Methylonatrum kenyense TaxID=455253 RepID=UPI0020BFC626|nr:23S rRNA (guanosine(2251)-2'-O)-methyltransferase RlmB [Methylonatrum kenyense]MCK8516129.1 23S rRNA (guanosine(2251)-2'-O)-methyltransferase RlmB [Methylonatrum kenyense]